MKSLIPQKEFTANSNSTGYDSSPKRKVNILMVDDRPENLLALEAVLKSPTYHLVSAHSAEEALKCVLKQDFAVILLDVQMPGLNGFETAKLIKAREKSKHIPIIFITAISQATEHVLHGYSVGAIDYIFKPFHPETLRLKVEEFVKIYQNHEQIKLQGEQLLEEAHEKLDRISFDLRKNEALARVISETLMDTIVTFDDRGYILTVNSAVEKMFGYSIVELVGEHISTILPAVKLEGGQVKKLAKRLVESVALRKDKSKFSVDIQIGDASIDDQPIFVCSIRDITARIQLEDERKLQYQKLENLVEERTLDLLSANEKLQEEIEVRKAMAEDLQLSQERFRTIFESTPCLIAIQSLSDKRYIDVNPSWLNYTGYSYEEVMSGTYELHHIITDFIDENAIRCSLEQHEPVHNARISYATKSGEVREGLLSTEIIDIQGEKCVLSMITDITERIRLEKEMVRLDRLNLIGEMAAGIAHEIRNPMTTVRGFLQMSMITRESPLQYVDLMLKELDRANDIITEFLNLAKNKVNDKRLHCLNLIIESLFPLIQAEALLSDKHVRLELTECPPLYVDEKEIRQMILNLALNGLEAMTSGGRLTIKTYAEDKAIVLEIIDQGCGIKPEFLHKIGTPFFTTKEKGTGLGLAICYSVADRHNAVIDVKTDDKGTVFYVRFKL